MSDTTHILVVQDSEQCGETTSVLSLIEPLYGEGSPTLFLLAFEACDDSLFGHFHHVFRPNPSGSGMIDIPAMCDAVEDLHAKFNFDCILVPATRVGRMLAPRIARRLHTGLVADVVEVKNDGDRPLMLRSAYSGNIMAAIGAVGDGPLMMSVHPGQCRYSKAPSFATQVHHFETGTRSKSSIRLLSTEKKPLHYDIRKSDILVSGGGGAKKHFALLTQLADALGGEVSASRKLVDQGIAPRSIQVGQSGKIVSPKLYIAIGIDGAIQHVEGMQRIETIISVNTSSKAPICALSDLVVEGDAKDFMEKLLTRISQDPQQGESR